MHRAPAHCALGIPESDQHVLQEMSTREALSPAALYEEASLEAEGMMQVAIYMHWKISPWQYFS